MQLPRTEFSTAASIGPQTDAGSVPALTVIRSRSGWSALNLRDLWRYRDLLLLWSTRDIRVRYKQTILGAGWAILQPLAMMVVFSIFFGRLMNVTDQVTPAYPVFVYAGLLPWLLFANSVTAASNSLVNNAQVLSKVYFPRLIMPIGSVGAPVVDFCVSFVVLLGLMLWYGLPFTWQLPALLPMLVVSVLITALGIGILMSALTVTYRDFRHVVPFMVHVWFFVTPVIYPVRIIPEQYQWLIHLNPMAGTISAFRAAVLAEPIDTTPWLISSGIGLVLLAIALRCFLRMERRFADVV
ncbi:MAG: phosphate ABC transporter permease [Phycisphaeraceae bacterium]|nr:phosphate ABC transporter permease [Phycisphaeraceae bacterium]